MVFFSLGGVVGLWFAGCLTHPSPPTPPLPPTLLLTTFHPPTVSGQTSSPSSTVFLKIWAATATVSKSGKGRKRKQVPCSSSCLLATAGWRYWLEREGKKTWWKISSFFFKVVQCELIFFTYFFFALVTFGKYWVCRLDKLRDFEKKHSFEDDYLLKIKNKKSWYSIAQ